MDPSLIGNTILYLFFLILCRYISKYFRLSPNVNDNSFIKNILFFSIGNIQNTWSTVLISIFFKYDNNSLFIIFILANNNMGITPYAISSILQVQQSSAHSLESYNQNPNMYVLKIYPQPFY